MISDGLVVTPSIGGIYEKLHLFTPKQGWCLMMQHLPDLQGGGNPQRRI